MKDLFSEIAATSGQYTFKDKEGNIREFPEKHAADIDKLLAEQAAEYPKDTYLMNMVTNHDLNSGRAQNSSVLATSPALSRFFHTHSPECR